MEKAERVANGNKFKAAFNLLWDKAVSPDDDQTERELSYRDMTRIADAMRAEGPQILGLEVLPDLVETSLYLATACVDPNKARSKETFKKGLSVSSGSAGLSLVAACLGTLVNPGAWAAFATIFAGGIAGGPLAVLGVTAGLGIVFSSIYITLQKLSNEERAVKAHDIVTKAVDKWINSGSKSKSIDNGELPVSIKGKKLEEIEMHAAHVLLTEVAKADDIITEEESNEIVTIIGSLTEAKLDYNASILILKNISDVKKIEIVSWCLKLAFSDGDFDKREKKLIKRIGKDLGVDLYKIQISVGEL